MVLHYVCKILLTLHVIQCNSCFILNLDRNSSATYYNDRDNELSSDDVSIPLQYLTETSNLLSPLGHGTSFQSYNLQRVEELTRQWAPLVWLAPGEQFFPSGVPEFLEHVLPWSGKSPFGSLPGGPSSESWFLVTKTTIDGLLNNSSSILYGQNPTRAPVPIYANVVTCSPSSFHVTYWFFFPFSQGKDLCTLDMGLLGPWPLPLVNNHCYGTYKDFGSHVGDWEHMSLLFQGGDTPSSMYVSAHDAGAFYKFNKLANQFVYERMEIRKGIMQRPTFPDIVELTPTASHPVLFAAKGSHGLWTAPGKHKYVRLPRLYDVSGYGIPWYTWQRVEIINTALGAFPAWLLFYGKWGNPRSKCHPLSRVGLHICQLADGPTGIPMKKQNFNCS
ncbi:hypothetical protein M8J76_009597 [Diaphorina citri]|nr:hypothetical protein M8J75_013782 [Diaphorina citri]KAI5741016.1 hypothetical protein M8J76_009597 [Diaphorina citri]